MNGGGANEQPRGQITCQWEARDEPDDGADDQHEPSVGGFDAHNRAKQPRDESHHQASGDGYNQHVALVTPIEMHRLSHRNDLRSSECEIT